LLIYFKRRNKPLDVGLDKVPNNFDELHSLEIAMKMQLIQIRPNFKKNVDPVLKFGSGRILLIQLSSDDIGPPIFRIFRPFVSDLSGGRKLGLRDTPIP
jgi:hypothetical protein